MPVYKCPLAHADGPGSLRIQVAGWTYLQRLFIIPLRAQPPQSNNNFKYFSLVLFSPPPPPPPPKHHPPHTHTLTHIQDLPTTPEEKCKYWQLFKIKFPLLYSVLNNAVICFQDDDPCTKRGSQIAAKRAETNVEMFLNDIQADLLPEFLKPFSSLFYDDKHKTHITYKQE